MNPEQTPETIGLHTVMILRRQGNVPEQSDLPMSYIHAIDANMYPKIKAAMIGAGEAMDRQGPITLQ